MAKEIQFRDVYDEIYDLMSSQDPKFPVKPELLSKPWYSDEYASFSARRSPVVPMSAEAASKLEPATINWNPTKLSRSKGMLRSEHLKELRYVAAHELGHAKDFENFLVKLEPEAYEKFTRSIKKRNAAMLGAETRAAEIYMPFLSRTFGRDALPLATKNHLIWREVLGEVMKEGETTAPNWKIVAEANERRKAGVRNKRLPMGMVEPLLKDFSGTTVSKSGYVYKNLAKIARKHGLLGLLMATMLTGTLAGGDE